MAKDGTARGGQRVGSGRKNNALADKITTGRLRNATVLPEPPEMEGLDMPPVREYMLEKQKDGHDLCAEDVYRETYEWLRQRKWRRRGQYWRNHARPIVRGIGTTGCPETGRRQNAAQTAPSGRSTRTRSRRTIPHGN